MKIELSELEKSLLSLDRLAVKKILTESGDGSTPIERVDKLIMPVLRRIGEEWDQGRISLSQVYMSGRVCEEVLDTILPPGDPNRKNQPKIAIARAGPGGGFILSDNHGEIPWQVPEEVLISISKAVHKWGRYPLNWVKEHDGS